MSTTLASLLKKSTIDDHDEVLKACEKELKGSSNDSQAQQAKAVALLKLERYEEALKYFNATAALKKSLPEAYAYCLYRSGKFEEAVKAASEVEDSRGAQHIKLQAAYRAEDWDAADQAYRVLSQSSVPSEDFDFQVNKLALDAEALWLEKLSTGAVSISTTDYSGSWEIAYNSACIDVAKGQLEKAEEALQEAVQLCEGHSEMSSEEKATELVSIKAQRLYVLQKLKRHDEAERLAKELKELTQGAALEATTKKLAENNILTGTNTSNPFLAYKTFESTQIPATERLFANQTTALQSNDRTMQLQTFKYESLINAGRKKQDSSIDSSSAALTSMFAAAALARSEISKSAINKVLPELERRPNDLGLGITIVQLYILTNNSTAAIKLLRTFFARLENSAEEKDKDVRFSPGLVGLMVSLYRSQGRQQQLKQELSKSASYWRNKPKAPSSLLRAAGIALLDSSDESDAQIAQTIFEKLRTQEPNEKSTIAGYVASHAASDDAEATKLADKLSSIEALTSEVDAAALENAGIPQSSNAIAIAQAGQSRKRPAADSVAGKRKKIRPSRMPKDFDPNRKPDPERWLPLRDRSTYKPKKKKTKRDDRTQGGGNVNESLDISNRPAGSGSEVISSNNAGGGKKKKGKGKK